jgi:WD40 repeat protein
MRPPYLHMLICLVAWSVLVQGARAADDARFESVYAVAFSPDGKTLATVSDKRTRLWDSATGKCSHTFPPYSGFWSTFAFSPDSRTFATGDDRWVRLWDVATGLEKCRLPVDSWEVASVVFSPDGRTLAIRDGNVFRANLRSRAEQEVEDGKHQQG